MGSPNPEPGVVCSWVVVSSVSAVMCPVAWVFRLCHCL